MLGHRRVLLRSPAVADTSWWLAGGISADNCVAAYRAKGAADYATSLVNLTGNATYNLTEQDKTPTWDIGIGWTFNDTKDYLTTGWTPSNISGERSAICKFQLTNTVTDLQTIFGERNVFFVRYRTTPVLQIYNGGGYTGSTATSGVVGIAGPDAWLDGSDIGDMSTSTAACYGAVLIGSLTGATGQGMIGNIAAIAFYNTTLTSGQMVALTTAINAL